MIVTVPEYRTIVIIEKLPVGARGGGRSRIPATSVREAESYAQRFEQLLGQGPEWIRLGVAGLLNDQLVVTLDHSATLGFAPDEVAINFAGPSQNVQTSNWQLPWLIVDV
jgi:hypothetical protein